MFHTETNRLMIRHFSYQLAFPGMFTYRLNTHLSWIKVSNTENSENSKQIIIMPLKKCSNFGYNHVNFLKNIRNWVLTVLLFKYIKYCTLQDKQNPIHYKLTTSW